MALPSRRHDPNGYASLSQLMVGDATLKIARNSGCGRILDLAAESLIMNGQNDLAIGRPQMPAALLPSFLQTLADLGASSEGVPLAIILPDNDCIAETVAILCARSCAGRARKAPETVLTSLSDGDRVRILPNEGVYQFRSGSGSGFWLEPLDIRNRRTAARFWVPPTEAGRLEPTIRKRPMGEAGRHAWAAMRPSLWDLFTGTPIWGNAALTDLAVVFIGARKDFQTAVESEIGFAGAPGELACAISDGLPWGDMDEEGELRILNPAGSFGMPLVAVARDHLSVKRFAAARSARSLIVVSSRSDDALNDRTSVEAIAERQRYLLISSGRSRHDLAARRQNGWTIVDLSRAPALKAGICGIAGIDRVVRTAAWMQTTPPDLAQRNRELELAFKALDVFGKTTELHAVTDEEIAECSRMLREEFFDASDWLGPPTDEDLGHLHEICDDTRRQMKRLRSVAGATAAEEAQNVINALETFARRMIGRTATPKGECLLKLAPSAAHSDRYRQIVAVGHGRTAKSVTAFLDANDCTMKCVTPSELARLDPVDRVNVLSMMRREAFARLVDPWAAPNLMFIGYQHEIDVYRRRLGARDSLIRSLAADAQTAVRLPALANWVPGTPSLQPDTVNEFKEPLAPVPRPVRQPPPAWPGDALRTARFCRFSGNSWMAVTDEHSFARVQEDAVRGAQVTTIEGHDLQTGDLILVREGSDKDVVREAAEQGFGREQYSGLRGRADLWRRELKRSGLTAESLRTKMAEQGLDRGLPTIRYWLSELGPIGPSDPQTAVPLIAAALDKNPAASAWSECIEAILLVRRLHVEAGFRLTQMLLSECGESILEHSENETPFELSMGTVWLLEVAHLNLQRSDWPAGQVNRLVWESDTWRRRLLARNRQTATLDIDLLLADIDAFDEST